MTHRNKSTTTPPTTPETAPETIAASETVCELTGHVLATLNVALANLAAMALRDQKLDPAAGWRYDANARRFVKAPA